jgi:4-amino-4-deoxy-L-arabinose transferase-like glycosyltransferase
MRAERLALLCILLAYLVLGSLYALRTPAWQAPDEPAHYNYIAQVARLGCCPVIEMGDWDSAYLEQLKAAEFAPELLANLPLVEYEDHQPPLYYFMLTPLYTLTNGDVLPLRLASLVFGAGTVACAYLIARLIFPRRRELALGVAALVAFVPQHLAVLASINNDALSGLLIALTLLGTLLYIRPYDAPPHISPWMLGVLLGLGLLTKVSTLFMLGIVGIAILYKWWASAETRSPQQLIRAALLCAVPALLIAGAWWVRNLSVYGVPDLFGLAAHDRVVVGQLRTDALIAQVGISEYWRQALTTSFQSFWGQFGWMSLPMWDWAYLGIATLLLLAGVGWLVGLARARGDAFALDQRASAVLLALAGGLALAQFAYYNTSFVQFQGRYAFTGLIPYALLIVGGLGAWDRLHSRLRWLWLLVLLLIPLNAYIAWRLLPGLAAGV